ncbi:SP_1767 family glycosyltransferase [Pontibacter toksunensis]|uniref:SP_1767 family glycosyltransferase n=1 Tax=Pontibacter toksunensis TaxID=1332631 RepID=A0ABW6BST4_9BACT
MAYKVYKHVNRAYSYFMHASLNFYINSRGSRPPKVLTIDETIREVIKTKCSVSRFGDGEMRLITKESIEFQEYTPELGARLQEVLTSNLNGHIVCLPAIFETLEPYKRNTRFFWRRHLSSHLLSWIKNTRKDKVYYNTAMTRPYYSFNDYDNSRAWFSSLKQIWNGRDIVFIEGSKSRLGVGNDLFDNATSVERILCPSKNAFARYSEIIAEANKVKKSKLVLIALGPTATLLAYDLHRRGYQAIDVGHVDIEYEWFLMKAKSKVNIAHKHTNEVAGNNAPDSISDGKYNSEIISSIV